METLNQRIWNEKWVSVNPTKNEQRWKLWIEKNKYAKWLSVNLTKNEKRWKLWIKDMKMKSGSV